MAIEVGQEAPDFTLVDDENNKVSLSEFRGEPVVLMFYPFDFSGLCTQEHCDVRDNYGSWMERGAKVLGISRDSRFSHAAFKAQENLPYPLLADMKGEVARKYDVWNEQVGCAERATFVVDREGQIAYAVHNGIPDARNHGEVEQHLQ